MRRKKSAICVWIAILVFLSGMYFEELKVDSSLACAASVPCIGLEDSVMTDMQVCTAEMLGIDENISSRQPAMRLVHLRRDSRVSLDFLCQNIFSPSIGRFNAGFEEIRILSDSPYELVTYYIHKTDGKKRI